MPFETLAGLCGTVVVAVGSDGTRVWVCVVVPSQTGVWLDRLLGLWLAR